MIYEQVIENLLNFICLTRANAIVSHNMQLIFSLISMINIKQKCPVTPTPAVVVVWGVGWGWGVSEIYFN